MSKKNMVAFRNAFSGYNKSDVNEYLQKLNDEFSETEKTLKAELETAKEEINSLADTLAETKSALEKSSCKIAEAEKDSALKAQTINALTAERDTLLEREKELAKKVGKFDGFSKKSERYDEISSQLGELIISAKKTANEIITAAKTESKELQEQTASLTLAAKESAENKAQTALFSINGIIQSMVEDTLGEIAAYIKEAQFEMTSLLTNMQGRNKDISEKISFISDKSVLGIKDEISKIEVLSLPDTEDDESVSGFLDKTEEKEV